jgi:outer membrane lipoprotein-sorting protein
MSALLAIALLFQEKTAEETFKKIEDTVHNAKTVRVKFAFEARKKEADKPTIVAEGTVLLKQGNKVFATESFLIDGKKVDKKQISDGSKMAFWVNDRREDKVTPKNEGAKFLNGVLRAGYVQAQLIKVNFIPLDPKSDPGDLDPRELFILLSDFAFGVDDKEAKTMTYKFKDYEGVQGKIWYDPKTWKLLKRTIEYSGSDAGLAVETYPEFTLNADIPDETFKLPGKE